jgi:translocation and assembly module TamB
MARWVSFIAAMVLGFCAASANAQNKALAEDLASKDDRGFIVGLLEDALGGEGRIVRVDGFQGALSKTATIQRMTIADEEGVWFTLDDVRLRWTRSALLRGQIDVQELSAAKMTLARAPIPSENALPSAEANGFSLPNLPVSVSIALMRIDRISLGRPILGEAAEMILEARADLANGSGSTSLRATRTDGKQGSFVIDASYDAESQMAAIDVDLTEASGGIAARMLNLPRLSHHPFAKNRRGSAPRWTGCFAGQHRRRPRVQLGLYRRSYCVAFSRISCVFRRKFGVARAWGANA